MTRSNMNSGSRPILLKPAAKDYLWGGNRLNTLFSKQIDSEPLAETWECSTHPDGYSIVDSGDWKGRTLLETIRANPSWLGKRHAGVDGLPVLFKLIDAEKDLSVQVHPDDEYAREHECGQSGKTEAWYILEAAEDSFIIYGFHHAVTKEQLRDSIADGTVGKYLQKVPVKKDDVFHLDPGTVHAIGSGVLIAEIQESSNLTYRLFDYDRRGKDGKRRELHIEKALDVLNLNASEEPRQPMRVLRYRRGSASELLARCAYFQMERLLINSEYGTDEFRPDPLSFQILFCYDGSGFFDFGEESLPFEKGRCIFVPADSLPMKLHGKAQFLKIVC